MTIGVILAMENELLPYLNNPYSVEEISGKKFYRIRMEEQTLILAYSGIGKVNAGYTASLLIYKYNPDYLISTGVSGGLNRCKIFDIVVGTATCQHDFDTSPLGDEIGLVSTVNKKFFPTDAGISKKFQSDAVKYGIIASGDQFVADKKRIAFIVNNFNAICCDMESGAIGQVCYMANKPYAVIRCISDNADNKAHMDFEEFFNKASDKLYRAVFNALKSGTGAQL